jgi:hypothetical protein
MEKPDNPSNFEFIQINKTIKCYTWEIRVFKKDNITWDDVLAQIAKLDKEIREKWA